MMFFPLIRDEPLWRGREGQSAENILYGYLPCGNSAKVHIVCRINKQAACMIRDFGGIGDNPEKCARIEQDFHSVSALKASMMSWGKGSKNSGGTRNCPFARPTGRRVLPWAGIGRISAIGTFLLQRRIVSPLARRLRYLERCVFASCILSRIMNKY